jgi:hypothetical protein
MRKFLVLSVLVCFLVSCSTPTTEKPAEAKPVVKADIRYYFEFNYLTNDAYETFETSVPDRSLSFNDIKALWDTVRALSTARASDYNADRIDFYDYFVPMGWTVKEIDEYMDKVDARGNGLIPVFYTDYVLMLYVEVQ